MLLGDLLTLHQLNLPVKIVVFRNDSLDFVELEMKAGGFLDFAVELKNPDFAALAESAGILGLKAETAQDMRPMLQKAFKHDGPALVEALVNRQELSNAANNHHRTSHRLRDVHAQSGDQRSRR